MPAISRGSRRASRAEYPRVTEHTTLHLHPERVPGRRNGPERRPCCGTVSRLLPAPAAEQQPLVAVDFNPRKNAAQKHPRRVATPACLPQRGNLCQPRASSRASESAALGYGFPSAQKPQRGNTYLQRMGSHADRPTSTHSQTAVRRHRAIATPTVAFTEMPHSFGLQVRRRFLTRMQLHPWRFPVADESAVLPHLPTRLSAF